MGRLAPLSGAEMVAVLHRAGFRAVGERGPHVKFRHPEGRVTVVPLHHTLARGTQRAILRQAGLSRDDFARLRQAGRRLSIESSREGPSP
jgi:predicted RNA binding protein YcfA (HicA-like mRNA interferase family)